MESLFKAADCDLTNQSISVSNPFLGFMSSMNTQQNIGVQENRQLDIGAQLSNMQINMENCWDQANQQNINRPMTQPLQAKNNQMADPTIMPIFMPEFQSPIVDQQIVLTKGPLLESPDRIKELEEPDPNREEEHMQSTRDLIAMMEADSDPKFQKSEFLGFLKKISSGEYVVKENQLLVNKEFDDLKLTDPDLHFDPSLFPSSVPQSEIEVDQIFSSIERGQVVGEDF